MKKYKYEDLKSRDIDLLATAYALPEESFLCFGKSYPILRNLDLITDENKISWYGKKLIKSLAV